MDEPLEKDTSGVDLRLRAYVWVVDQILQRMLGGMGLRLKELRLVAVAAAQEVIARLAASQCIVPDC